jgi:hypothetical protein
LITFDTVIVDTPADRATSAIVTTVPGFFMVHTIDIIWSCDEILTQRRIVDGPLAGTVKS